MVFPRLKETSVIRVNQHCESVKCLYSLLFSGAGGGRLFVNVTNLLEIDGTLSADGSDAQTQGGGGSGGSVWVLCDVIKGYGQITANGGSSPQDSAGYHGGGGAGGRVAVYFRQNDTFSYFR